VTHPSSRRLIVALDFDRLADAYELAGWLVGLAGIFKIGKQLFTSEGPEAVRKIASLGSGVFLDLKYHDIPNTVACAVRAAAKLPGLELLNVHTLGGLPMMRAGAAELAGLPKRPKLIGVTVLTSMDPVSLKQVGISASPAAEVLRLAKLAKKAGLDGVVCSAHEVKAIRKALGAEFVTAVGGVRPGAALVSKKDDQSRIMSPAQAIRAGATYLIVGRPITGAADPVVAARAILDEVAEAEGGPRRAQVAGR
jgi:orotidine-5'-phosphate decarboxylase